MKNFAIKHAFKLAFILAAIITIFSVPALADDNWEVSKTRKASPVPPLVIEVDVMPEGCYQNRTPFVAAQPAPKGCYIPWYQDKVFPFFITPGWILLAKNMSPWERECNLRHEEDHDGYNTGVAKDHRVGYSDC